MTEVEHLVPGGAALTGRGASRGVPRGGGLALARLVVVVVCTAIFAVPLAAIVVTGAAPGAIPILIEGGIGQAALNSLVSAVVSAVAAVVVGGALALLLDHSDLPGARVVRLLLLSPLLVPPFVGAIAWVGVLGPQSAINTAWAQAFGGPLWTIYGGAGVTFLLALHSYPVAYLVIGAALRRIPGELEQAARGAGAGPLRAMRDVTVPLLRPAMLAAFVLIAVANLADFGIPSIVGLPQGFTTLSTIVYRYIQSGTVADPLQVVSAVGIVLLVIAATTVLLSTFTGRARSLEQTGAPAGRVALGRARIPAAVTIWCAAALLTVLPLAALVEQALIRAPGLPLRPENLSLDGFVRAVASPSALAGIGYSLWLSLAAALACGLLGLVVGTLITRTRWRGNRALGILVLLPQAIPGLVIAVGWLLIAPFAGIFDTPWVILGAYVMAFTGMVVQSVTAPLSAVSGTLEEAARSSGAGPVRTLADVSLRLAVPAAATGAVLVALTAVRELTISVLLVAPGQSTLGVTIFDLQQSGAWGAASSLSLLVTLVGLAGLGLAAPRGRSARDTPSAVPAARP